MGVQLSISWVLSDMPVTATDPGDREMSGTNPVPLREWVRESHQELILPYYC